MDHPLHAQMQAVAHALAAAFPADRGGGNLVEQTPGRMTGTAEQAFIEQGDLEQWNVQASDQAAQGYRQVVVGLDEVEQQADQIEGVFVSRVDPAARAAAHAHPQQQLLQLLAKREVIRLAGGRYIVLKMRQQAQQIGGADRLGAGDLLHTRRDSASDRGQQCLYGIEERLACAIEIRRFVARQLG